MKVIKRIVCIFLSVMILFFGVNNSYFSLVKMDQVEAAGTVVLGYETMQAICYYFGSLVLGYSSVAEVPDLTEEQIEKVGHAYIKSLFTVNGVPDHVADKLAMANQALFTLISNKQAYVFGSEALKEVAETEFQVIMGGNNGDEEPSPSPDEKKKLNIGKAIGCIGALSVFGATVFEESLKFYSDKFSKGEECFLDDAYIASLKDERFTRYEDLWVEDANAYNFKAILSTSYTVTSGFHTGMKINSFSIYQAMESTRLHIVKEVYDRGDGVQVANYYFRNDKSNNTDINYNYKYYQDGVLTSNSNQSWSSWNISGIKDVSFTLYTNIPIFDSDEAWKKALLDNDFSNALNYLKEYRIADWLQDNWDGELFDPLTGLSYLNDLANLAKHQGLNAIGNDPSLDDMKQHLRDIIANLRPGYDPLTDPSVDPALDPICYPDTIPTPVIDPTADVVLQPEKDPTPSPNPDPSPSTSPKPTTQPTPSPGEGIDNTKPVVDLSKFFPFCIPFDLIHLVQALDADPVAPKWTLKLEPPQFPVEWEVTLDLSQFESLAKIFRTGETLLFVVGLILITRGIIKG